MKKIIFLTIICLVGLNPVIYASGTSYQKVILPNGDPVSSFTIDQSDSVFFDLFQVVVSGDTVTFPVSIQSDDVINALDFAFKYDQTHLIYDTIINLTNYIEPLSFYNTIDSTVRLTSYSFTQPYANSTPLFNVRFRIISGQVCSSDIIDLATLLNGDASGHMIIQCNTTGLEEYIEDPSLNVFPNPATDRINLEVSESSTLEISDITSRKVILSESLEPGYTQVVSTYGLNNGIYIVKITGEKYTTFKKIVIEN